MNTEPSLTIEQAKDALKSAIAPRVTEESIKAKISQVHYLQQGTTTICTILMQNGFKFIGHSTPASPDNYNSLVGQRYAYENAFKQIWSHEGYLLRERLHEQEKL